jgi:hypothetical protein
LQTDVERALEEEDLTTRAKIEGTESTEVFFEASVISVFSIFLRG